MSLQDLRDLMEGDTIPTLECEAKNTISLYILYYILLALIGKIRDS